MLLRSHLEEIIFISTEQRRLKGSSSKIPVDCPNVTTEDNVLTWSKIEILILSPFVFYLFDVAPVNYFVVYKKLENKDLTLKKFNICIALKLIAVFISHKSCPNHCPSKRTKGQRLGLIPPSQFPIFLETRRWCTVCSKAGKKREHLLCVHNVM